MQYVQNPTVAYSVLESNVDLPSNITSEVPQKPIWLSQYNNGALVTAYGDGPRPPVPADVGEAYDSRGYGVDNMQESLSMPKSYNYTIQQNTNLDNKLKQLHLPSEQGMVLPEPIPIPTFQPPYGTPYPSAGYSAYDTELVRAGGIPMGYAPIPYPIASPPALQMAKNAPSVPMSLERYEKHDINCSDTLHHFLSCSICKSYIYGNTKLLTGIIIFLGIIVIILLIVCFRKK